MLRLLFFHRHSSWIGFSDGNYLVARHILYIFDSCFSGLATIRSGQSRLEHDNLLRKARVTITAGGADQRVVDGGWENHSIFTGLLLRGLLGDAQRDNGGVLTVTELFNYLRREVSVSAPQTPAHGYLPGHEGGDVLFDSIAGIIRPLPISIDPVPYIKAGKFAASGHTTRSSYNGEIPEELLQHSLIGTDIPIFAEGGRQWAVIIGTNPGEIGISENSLPTEFLDASDILDWFINPDIYGAIPSERLFFWVNEDATSQNIFQGLDIIRQGITYQDSLLFYFSGHAVEFTDPGEILLYNAFEGEKWAQVSPTTPGIISAPWLVEWFNSLPAQKVVCLLDSGGPAFFNAGRQIREGRFIISSLRSRTLGRNGLLTWYIRRTVQKLGQKATIGLLYRILREADRFHTEKGAEHLYFYLRGSDTEEGTHEVA